MKLTKEQIDEIVAAAYPTPHADMGTLRSRLTRAFGRERNPYEDCRKDPYEPYRLIPDLFDAAAKVADGCDAEGFSMVGPDATAINRAALKKLVEEIRGMA